MMAGMLKMRMFRPFPGDAVRKILGGVPKVAVVDRNCSLGAGGIFAREIRSELCSLPQRPAVYSYIAGLGGIIRVVKLLAVLVDQALALLSGLLGGGDGPPSGARLLHLAGAEVRGDLEGATTALGFAYERRVVYAARARPWLAAATIGLLSVHAESATAQSPATVNTTISLQIPELLFIDGIQWMKDAAGGSLDVIIVDSTDPVGPGEVLFTPAFYAACERALDAGGLMVQQSESPLIHLDVQQRMYRHLSGAGFDPIRTLFFPQPIYPTGWWSATLGAKGRKDSRYLIFRFITLWVSSLRASPRMLRAPRALGPMRNPMISGTATAETPGTIISRSADLLSWELDTVSAGTDAVLRAVTIPGPQLGVAVGDEIDVIETTRGWLSKGISQPMVVYGGDGDDLLAHIDRDKFLLLPNTSGARDAEEAVRLARLARAIDTVTGRLEAFDLGGANRAAYDFVWSEFCDWYVELVKPRLFEKDADGKVEHVWATSWGMSTRIVGSLIMVHSDDDGLVLPPKIAGTKAVIVPIWKTDEEKAAVDKVIEVYGNMPPFGLGKAATFDLRITFDAKGSKVVELKAVRAAPKLTVTPEGVKQ